MAYNLEDRFRPPPKYYRILDPGAYQNNEKRKFKQNTAPFLANIERKTTPCNKIWTHTIHNVDLRPKIANCTSLQSKVPRFAYEALRKEYLDQILCRCGIDDTCECPTEDVEGKEEILCQGNVPKCIYKGHPPRSFLGDSGLSSPSKGDKSGHQKRVILKKDNDPPFYDARVIESTAFYQGCKWGSWTSKRSTPTFEKRPGPADYTINRQPTTEEICNEKVRHFKRKFSKQLRFIEMIQQRNISEQSPGPSTYTPNLPNNDATEFYGSKAERFPVAMYDQRPGPADYSVKRDFDIPDPPDKPCHAKLPEPSCFGVNAMRFKPRKEEGPSPASYNVNSSACYFMQCSEAPFNSTSVRFKEEEIIDDDDENLVAEKETEKKEDKENIQICPNPTWEFRSRTIRMKPLVKKPTEPSPADLPQSRIKVERLPQLQYIAPFYSSEGRFEPWYDWMPVFGRVKTPGPAYYCLNKPSCLPAVNHGPLFRTPRFPGCKSQSPACNQYSVGAGIETILFTHNNKLKQNIENQHKFIWVPPPEPKKLSFEEQEELLFQKCISILDMTTKKYGNKIPKAIAGEPEIIKKPPTEERQKPKFLRSFLHTKQFTSTF